MTGRVVEVKAVVRFLSDIYYYFFCGGGGVVGFGDCGGGFSPPLLSYPPSGT